MDNFYFPYEMVVRVDGGVHLSLNVLTWHDKKLIILFKFPRAVYIFPHIIVYLVFKTILQRRYYMDLKNLHVWELQI